MKLNRREERTKKQMIRTNRKLISHVLGGSIADCFAGTPKKTISEDVVRIEFRHANVGLSNEDELDKVFVWVHEFTEHVIGRLILEMLVEEGLTLGRMADIICDGIITKNVDGGLYDSTVKHVMAALCTSSIVDGIKTTPEEYAEMFGFKKRPRSVMDNAAPFDPLGKTGVRCRFEFGRGLSNPYESFECENWCTEHSLIEKYKNEVK